MITSLATFFEQANQRKDDYVFGLIKNVWPKKVTPNHLTIIRIIIGVAITLLLFQFNTDTIFLIFPLFFAGVLTDLLDGVLARGFGMETHFGKIADPIADRIIILPVATYSLIGNHSGLLFFILALEMHNGYLALVARARKIDLGGNIFGKVKMFLQSVVFVGVLFFWSSPPQPMFVSLLWMSIFLMLISVVLRSIAIFRHEKIS